MRLQGFIKSLLSPYFFFFLLLLIFLFTRLPFFIYYHIPGATRDTFTYYHVVYNILHGTLPILDDRTIGYPFFLFLIELVGSSPLKVLFAQCVISLLSAMFYVHIVYKYFKVHRWAFIAGMLIFYASPFALSSDTDLMPTSLFSSLIIISLGFLIKGIQKDSASALALYSLTSALAILVRPQGLFFLPVIALLAFYLFFIQKKRRLSYFTISPVAIVLFCMSAYNYGTFGRFTLTDFTALNNLGSSIYAMETDPSYPAGVNQLIDETNKGLPAHNMQVIHQSKKYNELKTAFSFWDEAWIFKMKLFKLYPPAEHREAMNMMSRIGSDAKRKHPDLYVKFVATNFILYYANFSNTFHFYYNDISNRCHYWQNGEYLLYYDNVLKLVWKDMMPYPKGTTRFEYKNQIEAQGFAAYFQKEKLVIKLNHYWSLIFNLVFANFIWVLGYFIASAWALFHFFRNYKSDNNNLFLAILFLYVSGNMALIMLIQYPFQRFSNPLAFIYYSFTLYILDTLLMRLNFYRTLKTKINELA